MTGKENMRLFVALDVPDDVRDALRNLIARLRPLCKTARWARPEGMHVTLKFIGHVEPHKLDAIRATLATIQMPEPIEINFRGVGFFPSARRPRVLWCGVEASANLAQLASSVNQTLDPQGIPANDREFTPHLTLARFKLPEGAEALIRSAAEAASHDFGSTLASHFHLYESFLKPSGAEYKKIETYPLVKEPS
jgi:RNA 2',3'-cyclic 3'-phosphodiesterase